MFDVNLFSNFSKPENSTKIPSGGESFPCQMVEPCGVLSPVISFNQGVAWNPSSYNYAQIADFDRFYWITEWTFNRGRWYANMRVDPLASWKYSILSLSEYVVRSSAEYDTYVIDSMYPSESRLIKRGYGFTPWKSTEGVYVIGVLGANNTSVSGVSYFTATPLGLNQLTNAMLNNPIWLGTQDDISEVLFKALVNPMQYVTSVMWLPVEPFGDTAAVVNAGWWSTEIALTNMDKTSVFIGGNIIDSRPAHPQSTTRGEYLNNAPYTQMDLQFPPFGKISLDPSKYPAGSPILYDVTIDPISGMGVLRITNDDGVTTGDYITAKVGVDLSVGQSTSSTLGNGGSQIAFTQNAVNSFPQSIPSLLGTIGDAISSVSPSFNTIAQNGGKGIYDLGGGLTMWYAPVVDADNDHFGKPLCKKRTLSSLSGYTVVGHADVNIPCTEAEKTAIKAFMEGGFFIE